MRLASLSLIVSEPEFHVDRVPAQTDRQTHRVSIRMGGVVELWTQDGHLGGLAVVVAVLALLAGLVFWSTNGGADAKRRKGMPPVPPGSTGWPLLGETQAYMTAAHNNRLSEFFSTRAAKYGKVFKTNMFFNMVVSLPAPEGNKFLFTNDNKLVYNHWFPSVAKLLGKGSFSIKHGDEHKRVRRLFTSFFNPDGLQKFVPRIDAVARAQLAKYWDGKDQIVAALVVKKFTFAIAADLFVSLQPNNPEFLQLEAAFKDYLGGILQLPIDLPGTLYHKALLAREAMIRTLHPLIQQRRQDLKDGKVSANQDLLSVLLTTPYENGSFMNEDEIKDNIVFMLFAGHDTSSTALAHVLKYLFLNPQCLKEAIQEQQEIAKEKAGTPLTWEDTRKMKYLWRVCQETLRLRSPAPLAFRKAIQDFEYDGHTIRKGWLLVWTMNRSHYSPEFFPNPEKFDPSRFEGSGPAPYTIVTFGGGPHMCLGNEFARMEILVYLHYLVLSFEWEMEDPEEIIRMDPMPSFAKNLQLKIRKKENALAL